MLGLEQVEDSIFVCATAIRWQVEVSVRFGEIPSADQAFAFQHRRFDLQLFRAALFCDGLDALVVVWLSEGVALRLSVVSEFDEAVCEVRDGAEAGIVSAGLELAGPARAKSLPCLQSLTNQARLARLLVALKDILNLQGPEPVSGTLKSAQAHSTSQRRRTSRSVVSRPAWSCDNNTEIMKLTTVRSQRPFKIPLC